MLIGVLLYFLLALALLALWFFASVRAKLVGVAQQCWVRSRAAGAAWCGAGRRGASNTGDVAGLAWSRLRSWVTHYAGVCLVALLLIAGVPLGAAALRSMFPVSSYDHTYSRPVDEQVTELLRGERLVPPPPLPPELFNTREVEQARPMTASASRQWELLDEGFRQRLLMLFKQMKEQHGYEMVLLEGYRSPERQARLAALGPSVTQAGPFESLHQHGLAADCAFMREGRIVLSERDPWAMRGYEKYGEVARSFGLTWGGGWRSLKDYGHVEWRNMTVRKGSDNRPAPSIQVTVKED
ncbi:M15 family metallopeptidase [Ideonella sp. YS5]|uniref:M15 family metallopeptidase n=1 Tax=Ideonella sp. YS5 TaxID=3453714 RepID=UPI003F70DA7B